VSGRRRREACKDAEPTQIGPKMRDRSSNLQSNADQRFYEHRTQGLCLGDWVEGRQLLWMVRC
jgi:hypothetical protein